MQETIKVFESNAMWYWKVLLVIGLLLFVGLFIVMTFLPLIKQRREKQRAVLHGETAVLQNLDVKPTQRIAVALDFSASDEKLIAHAIAQGHESVTYILLHVVESVSARYLGEASDDDETRRDKLRIENYASQLQQKGYKVETRIGYRNRVKRDHPHCKRNGN